MSKTTHTQRFLENRRSTGRLSPRAGEYADRKYGAPFTRELIEMQRKDRTRDVVLFSHELKLARSAARSGDCVEAERRMRRARDRARDLVELLPSIRREVTAKIHMVDDVVANAMCSRRRR